MIRRADRVLRLVSIRNLHAAEHTAFLRQGRIETLKGPIRRYTQDPRANPLLSFHPSLCAGHERLAGIPAIAPRHVSGFAAVACFDRNPVVWSAAPRGDEERMTRAASMERGG